MSEVIDKPVVAEPERTIREIVRWLRQGPVGVVQERKGKRVNDPNVKSVCLDNVAAMIESRWL